MLELVLNKLGLKRLELYDGKLSRTVLRGWKRWKRLFYYPTLNCIVRILLVVTLSIGFRAYASDNFEDITSKAREAALLHLEDILKEAKMNHYLPDEVDTNIQKKETLYIFVSTSMPISLLEDYYREACIYNASLVFNGLPQGSFVKLQELILKLHNSAEREIAKYGNEAGSVIDDESFKKFGVKNVPTFVLLKEEDCFSEKGCKTTFDKLEGNIRLKRALEEFSSHGDLAPEAREVLK